MGTSESSSKIPPFRRHGRGSALNLRARQSQAPGRPGYRRVRFINTAKRAGPGTSPAARPNQLEAWWSCRVTSERVTDVGDVAVPSTRSRMPCRPDAAGRPTRKRLAASASWPARCPGQEGSRIVDQRVDRAAGTRRRAAATCARIAGSAFRSPAPPERERRSRRPLCGYGCTRAQWTQLGEEHHAVVAGVREW